MDDLAIENLIITQHNLRSLSQIPEMILFVKQKGIWNTQTLAKYSTRSSPLIQISRFPDGKDFIHDGHHRIVATWIGGRKVLYKEEYKVSLWTYQEYLEINFSVGWVTPFDPRTHCRKPELHDFKKLAKDEAFIRNNLEAYCEVRKFNTIPEFVETLYKDTYAHNLQNS